MVKGSVEEEVEVEVEVEVEGEDGDDRHGARRSSRRRSPVVAHTLQKSRGLLTASLTKSTSLLVFSDSGTAGRYMHACVHIHVNIVQE